MASKNSGHKAPPLQAPPVVKTTNVVTTACVAAAPPTVALTVPSFADKTAAINAAVPARTAYAAYSSAHEDGSKKRTRLPPTEVAAKVRAEIQEQEDHAQKRARQWQQEQERNFTFQMTPSEIEAGRLRSLERIRMALHKARYQS
ncbi:MAG: hypothetical protein H9847_05510 [Candidatus Anaerobiospirillum pullicola]|uniref:Uncharacterized protein n=1 Tax=Candidatus Anaerobiospirillum pullicola TaxID=2838451 RepID=A0A948TFY7_9GAMM|nr:hypothetical protein [Candidatus Anaerobiospirillum pullicola]